MQQDIPSQNIRNTFTILFIQGTNAAETIKELRLKNAKAGVSLAR